MYVLGLNIGHNSTACLLKDGKIIGCISEERFSRIKNYYGIPIKSIQFLLNDNGISIDKLDFIVLDNHYIDKEKENFTKSFIEAYTDKSKKKKILSKLGYKFPKLFNSYLNRKESLKNLKKREEKIRIQISTKLDYPIEKILVIDHHLTHTLSCLFNLTYEKNKNWLIFTLDGEGSGICASVSTYNGHKLKIISKSKKTASLGYLYALTTLYLGMKPLEHEFKVMGLAPYAKKDKINELYPKLKDLFWFDDLEFKSKFNMVFSDYFLETIKFYRFDNIAASVQKLTEELICEWINNAIKKTGICNIALSGGVFMNVKANKKASEIPEVKDIFIMPSSGDESNAIGACLYGYKEYCERNNIKFEPKPIKNLYLGPVYDNSYIEDLIKREELIKKYKIKKYKNINKEVAKLLAKGEIIARCSGKSEWGARALGNRSILSSAKNHETIKILNETIKDRDFWMPFTPSILDKYSKRYIVNPKKIFSPYMVITFDSTKKAREEIPAAMHPYDQTVRPQVVTKDYNKDYYEIIEEFSKLTGIGGILNTSFNIHGEPNVLTPEDALYTVEKSDLKFLVMENYLFEKIS
ncbi:MAG TPA: carbamoyltransferase C-terminal domain-containing protein [Candidatus Paceibacterota bacterium]|nr:carbamoyltransferase C-terminal domain-containing protein [Candidatus Paceibacterota bacterium]